MHRRFVLPALVVLTTSVVPRAGQEAPQAIVRVVPSAASARPGALLQVAVTIRDARNAGSVPFTLTYDPAILEVLPSSSTEGDFLRRGGTRTSFLAVGSTRGGSIAGVIVGLSRLRPDKGASGRGTLCRLTFRARAPGFATLGFREAAVLNPSAGRLSASFQGASILVKEPL
jgi:general secretion pathway protein D